MSRSIQIRVEDDLKKKSDLLFKELGTDTTSAIRMFLTQAVANNGFPFALKKITIDPYMTFAEDEEGKVRDADDVISDMKQKYGIYCYKDHSNRGDQFRYTR